MKIKCFPIFALIVSGVIVSPLKIEAVVPAPDGGYPGGNTAEGQNALFSLTTGRFNTAAGYLSLRTDENGSFNTGVGAGTLFANTGDQNTATGSAALLSNTTGFGNTASGAFALFSNANGGGNTAMGQYAMLNNTAGGDNTAIGNSALMNNAAGNYNAAVGFQTLFSNTTGSFNTAVGNFALSSNSSGSNNTAVGRNAGHNTTEDGNVYIGMGMEGFSGESNHTYIRNIKDTSVSGTGTDTVTVNLTTGLLGHPSSSRRYKQDIKSMDSASETIYRLKPVTYRFKRNIDPSQSLEYGLVAEEVAQVDPNLAVRNGDGQIENVRYTAVNAMLLNEFLKEHKRVEQLEATVARQRDDFQAAVAKLTAQVQDETAHIHKLGAQVEFKQAGGQLAVEKQ